MSADYGFVFTSDERVRRSPGDVDVRRRLCVRHIEEVTGSSLSRDLADLVDIAMSAYVSDRLAPRRAQGARKHDFSWQRNIHIEVPVRNMERWQDKRLVVQLQNVLYLLTGDKWHFDFVLRADEMVSPLRQGRLFESSLSSPPIVALFSGGLDSFAGLCNEINEHPGECFVLVSASTSGRLAYVQRQIIQALRTQLNCNIYHIVIPLGLIREGLPYNDDENTQRSRGFLYVVLGAVTALALGSSRLTLFENGIGAINLPYSDVPLGTEHTRAIYPRSLFEMSTFLSTVMGAPFSVNNPSLLSTKGVMCRSVANLGLGDISSLTVSCDGFPQRNRRHQCGICSSCLLRRQALHSSCLSPIDMKSQRYRWDILLGLEQLSERRRDAFNLMDGQVATLQETGFIWPALSQKFPLLCEVEDVMAAEGLPRANAREGLVRLYSQYCTEWASFSNVVAGVLPQFKHPQRNGASNES